MWYWRNLLLTIQTKNDKTKETIHRKPNTEIQKQIIPTPRMSNHVINSGIASLLSLPQKSVCWKNKAHISDRCGHYKVENEKVLHGRWFAYKWDGMGSTTGWTFPCWAKLGFRGPESHNRCPNPDLKNMCFEMGLGRGQEFWKKSYYYREHPGSHFFVSSSLNMNRDPNHLHPRSKMSISWNNWTQPKPISGCHSGPSGIQDRWGRLGQSWTCLGTRHRFPALG